MKELILNGVGTFSEWGLRMTSRPSASATVKRSVHDVMHRQGVVDMSRGTYGELGFDEKQLPYKFSKVIDKYDDRERLHYAISQWAYEDGDRKLIDTSSPNLHYKDVMCVDLQFSNLSSKLFTVQIGFVAYPLRIANFKEGHDVWDDLMVSDELYQPTQFYTATAEESAPYKMHAIGDLVTISAWVNRYAGMDITPHISEQFYEVGDVRSAMWHGQPYNAHDYYLKGINLWISDYFITQSHKSTAIELHNLGKSTAIPQILIYNKSGAGPGGLNIEMENGEIYRLNGTIIPDGFTTNDVFNDKVALKPGINRWKLYAIDKVVHINWHKEVI